MKWLRDPLPWSLAALLLLAFGMPRLQPLFAIAVFTLLSFADLICSSMSVF